MPTKPEHVVLSQDQAQQRLDTLVLELDAFLQEKGELTDIVLDALLNTYLKIAANTGRIQETPVALINLASRVSRALSTSHPITTH